MKLFMITVEDFSHEESSGICRKIKAQIQAFRDANFSVSYCYLKDGVVWVNENGVNKPIRKFNTMLGKIDCHSIIARYLKNRKYDCIYIRYALADFEFISMLRATYWANSKIVIEIPTYPYSKLLGKDIKGRISFYLDLYYSKYIYHYCNLVATYSMDQEIWGVKAIKVVNGYDFSKTSVRDFAKIDESINLIAVANFGLWHGYDRVIEGLHQYYDNSGERNIIFHVVGAGAPQKAYEESTRKYKLEGHVVFHGSQSGELLDKIYDCADIAVCSLASHRSGISGSSELKSREYAAKGLPMIASSDIDIFESDFPYIMYIGADEMPVDIERVCQFYDRIYQNEDKSIAAYNIRDYAVRKCDVSVFMNEIIDFYKEESN